jgi:hypothetical protein
MAFDLTGQGESADALRQTLESAWGQTTPIQNRRADRLTTVVMTGVTALTRATAWQMDRSGVTFPSRDIGDWLRQGDLTHISSEVAFTRLPDLCRTRRYSSARRVILLCCRTSARTSSIDRQSRA